MDKKVSTSESAYQSLEDRFRRAGLLGEVGGMLGWDMAVNMPRGGAQARSEQSALIAEMAHSLIATDDMGDLLDQAEADPPTDPWARANLAEMRRAWVHAAAVPADLVTALSRAASSCEMVWREARPDSQFLQVAPKLEELLGLVKEQAQAKAEALGCDPYDALLDMYEAGGRAERISEIFTDLKAFLPDFTRSVLDKQASQSPVEPLDGPFPVPQQKKLGESLMKAAGFDFDHGRLDVSLHPFCGGVPEDVRLTTRYDEEDFTSALMGVMHETGHALYEMGLPKDWRRQPVGEARSMSIHESQSLLIEMQACRSPAFISWAAPLMREAFDGKGSAWREENILKLYSRVTPDFIRVDADEVTYPSHVILRFELEQALISGDLAVYDLPGAWDDGMEALLGVRPPEDRLGCLQDIHWYDGAFGYFPTYTLGAMTAAQLFDAAVKSDPAILTGLGRGDFAPLMTWLRAKVHGKASLLSVDDLVREASGRPLEAQVFKDHLKARYLDA